MDKACGMLLALAGGMFAAGSAFGALGSTVWRGTVDDFYDKEGNWSNGLPSGTEKEGQFQTTADFTVKFPSGGYEEASFSGFYANSSGKSILVDTVGTWWLKGAGTYPSNWQAFRVSGNNGSGHFFTMLFLRRRRRSPRDRLSRWGLARLPHGDRRVGDDVGYAAAEEREQLREEARKTAAEKRNRRVSTAVDAF